MEYAHAAVQAAAIINGAMAIGGAYGVAHCLKDGDASLAVLFAAIALGAGGAAVLLS